MPGVDGRLVPGQFFGVFRALPARGGDEGSSSGGGEEEIVDAQGEPALVEVGRQRRLDAACGLVVECFGPVAGQSQADGLDEKVDPVEITFHR